MIKNIYKISELYVKLAKPLLFQSRLKKETTYMR